MAKPLAVDNWTADAVRLGDVVGALADLRHQSSERGSARTAVMTIIAVAPGDQQAYEATNALRLLGGNHPARILILRPDPDQAAGLDARATLFAVEAGGHHVNFEELTLAVRGQAARHLDSIVEAFTLSDLPIAVWYVSAVPDAADPLLTVASAVLIDSRDAAGPTQLSLLLDLARRQTVVDLCWRRLAPWRELLAGLFDPPACREWLTHVERVEVSGKEGPRRLLGGWLSGQLALGPGRVTLSAARHVEIRVSCRRDGEAATFDVQRGEQHRTVSAQAKLPGRVTPRQTVALSEDPLPSALAGALTHLEADPTWERALFSASVLGG